MVFIYNIYNQEEKTKMKSFSKLVNYTLMKVVMDYMLLTCEHTYTTFNLPEIFSLVFSFNLFSVYNVINPVASPDVIHIKFSENWSNELH